MGNGQPRRHSGRRVRRVALLAVAALLGVLALGAVLAPIVLRGPRLGRLIERNLPALRGKVHVGGGSWTWTTAWALWRGRPAPFALDDVSLIDPEGAEVFRAARLTGEVEVSADRWRVGVHHLQVVDAYWRFARMRSRSDIGFLAALSPAPTGPAPHPSRAPGPVATAARRSGPTFRIFEARLVGLTATFAFPEWELSLRDVHAAGGLAFDGSRGAKPAFVFEVPGGDVRGGGELAIVHRATRFALPFEHAWLNRVAATAAAPDAIVLNAAPVVAARGARLTFAGRFTGVHRNGGPSLPPGIEATIRGQGAAAVIQQLLSSLLAPAPPPTLGGRDASLVLRLSGRFAALTIDAAADGFDVRRGALDLRAVGLRAWAQPATRRLRLDALTARSPGGGQVSLRGGVDGRSASAVLAFDKFSASEFLPDALRPVMAGILDGTVTGGIDISPPPAPPRLFIQEVALVLTRPPGSPGPRLLRFRTSPRHHAGGRDAAAPESPPPSSTRSAQGTAGRQRGDTVIVLPRIAAPAWGGTVSAWGTLRWGAVPRVDVTVMAKRILAEQVLGSTFVTGPLSFRAQARGTLAQLEVRVQSGPEAWLGVLGAQFGLPPVFSFNVARGRLSLPPLRLAGRQGGVLSVSGGVEADGMDVAVAVESFPFARLPGLADTTWPVGGRLTGKLRISGGGSGHPWAASGRLSMQDTTFHGKPLGGGELSITAAPGGAMRVRGQMSDGVTLDGALTPGPGGVSGAATLQLREVRLEPFLAGIPGLVTAGGLVSGAATARVSPGAPVLVEARLSKLALTLTGPPRSASTPAGGGSPAAGGTPARGGERQARPRPATPHTIDLHATSEVVLAARGDGWLRLRPTRLVGSAGALEMHAEVEAGRARAALRGHLELGALSALAGDLLGRESGEWRKWRNASDTLAGQVDLDLDVGGWRPAGGLPPLVTGAIGLDVHGTLPVGGAPVQARIKGGRILLKADRSVTLDVPVSLAEGTVRLTGGWRQSPGVGTDRDRLTIDAAGDLDVRALQGLAAPHLQDATGLARIAAHVGGTAAHPTVTAQLGVAGISFTLPGASSNRVRIAAGQLELDHQTVRLRGIDLRMNPRTRVIVGGHPGLLAPRQAAAPTPGHSDVADAPAIIRFEAFQPLSVVYLDVPVEAEGVRVATRTALVEDARLALRLRGDPRRGLQLAGTVELLKARFWSRPRAPARDGATPAAATKLPDWVGDPRIQQLQMDLRVRSQGGAITLEVPFAPDVRVDLDHQIRGTPKRPQVSGDIHSSGPYSSFALFLYRLFK